MRRFGLVLWFLFSCKGPGGGFSDPPPSPGLTPEQAQKRAEEENRQAWEFEHGHARTQQAEGRGTSGRGPAESDTTGPRSFVRPLTGAEEKILHEALVSCTDGTHAVQVMVEPGGVAFLAPDQRFLEKDLACFAEKLGSVRLSAGVSRKGTVRLP